MGGVGQHGRVLAFETNPLAAQLKLGVTEATVMLVKGDGVLMADSGRMGG